MVRAAGVDAVPGGGEATRPGAEVCWFDEDKATLAKRVPNTEPHFTFGRGRTKAPAVTPPLSGPEAGVEAS